jgi:hypothetical protein
MEERAAAVEDIEAAVAVAAEAAQLTVAALGMA